MAKMQKHDGQKLYFVYATEFVYPWHFDPKDLQLLDEDTPKDWISTDYPDCKITSFPEWANDQHFYGYLVDDYDPEATIRADSILRNKLSEYINGYAVQKYGSIKAAKEYVLRKRYEDKLKLHKERGYEKPEDLEITDEMLNQVVLDINDLYRN
jgi:hypothetical protein